MSLPLDSPFRTLLHRQWDLVQYYLPLFHVMSSLDVSSRRAGYHSGTSERVGGVALGPFSCNSKRGLSASSWQAVLVFVCDTRLNCFIIWFNFVPVRWEPAYLSQYCGRLRTGTGRPGFDRLWGQERGAVPPVLAMAWAAAGVQCV